MNTKYRVQSKGFTLIELVVVIVILGILAATVAPKFINLSGDANKAVLKSLVGNIKSSAQLVYSKSIIQAIQKAQAATVDIDGDGNSDLKTQYGYPSAHRTDGIMNALDINQNSNVKTDWTWSGNGSNNIFYITTANLGGRSGLYVSRNHISDTDCYITYAAPANAGDPPLVVFIDTGC